MIWVDRLAKKIKKRQLSQEWVDDMKTPSGRIHVGSLRGVVIHDLVYKVLKENQVNVNFSYVCNDMDPMDGLPVYLKKDKYLPFMGKPLSKIPSPDHSAKSYADYFFNEFVEVFHSLGCRPKLIYSSELYRQGKMNEVVKIVLNNVDRIRKIYEKVLKRKMPSNWFPYNPVCERCGKIGTTDVYRWDGEYVYYRCLPNKVEWAKGCGYEGKIRPIGDNGKLVWKIDWPAHWRVIGITIEASGKDHMSAGGSYDLASHIAKEIFNYPPPEAFGGYEWFTIGGKKMSSSKGVGSSSREVAEILPPEVLRFLFVRSPITTHIDFKPEANTIFNLFDDYDRCLNAYFNKLEKKLPAGKQTEVILDFARIFELSQIKPLPKKRFFVPRFRTVFNLLKAQKDNFLSIFESIKKDRLNKEEKEILEERVKYAKKLLTRENPEISKVSKKVTVNLTDDQKRFFNQLVKELANISSENKEKLQPLIFKILKEGDFSPKKIFPVFYQILTGQSYGPRIVDLIREIGIEEVIKKIKTFL